MEKIIDSEGTLVVVYRNYVTNPKQFYDDLVKTEWEWKRQKVWNNECAVPRGMYVCGDYPGEKYRYSKIMLDIHEWSDGVDGLRDSIKQLDFGLGVSLHYDTCLMNYYRDGNDYVAYHSDDEALGLMNGVVTVSLGESRRFLLKHKETGKVTETLLRSGDLAAMLGECQNDYHHSIPKGANVRGGRISLTYRLYHK